MLLLAYLLADLAAVSLVDPGIAQAGARGGFASLLIAAMAPRAEAGDQFGAPSELPFGTFRPRRHHVYICSLIQNMER
jgi:hypothetical protein